MTRFVLHAGASRVLWTGCGVHILALLLLLPYDLGHASSWIVNLLTIAIPLLLLLTYGTAFVTAPPPAAPGRRRWTNGKVFLGWFVLAVVLLCANLLNNFRIDY